MTTPLEKKYKDILSEQDKSTQCKTMTVDGKEVILPNDPMTIAELYADGIVDLSVKLQEGNRSAKKAVLPKDINEPVNLNILDIYETESVTSAIPGARLTADDIHHDQVTLRPGDKVTTFDGKEAVVTAVYMRDKDTKDC